MQHSNEHSYSQTEATSRLIGSACQDTVLTNEFYTLTRKTVCSELLDADTISSCANKNHRNGIVISL